MSKTNVELLAEAGLINPNELSADETKLVNGLSDGEVHAAIAAAKKIQKPGAPVMKVAL